ncbi:hypothetical protein [Sulfurimonas sp. HSL3-7]|uniref:variant leucine-rich repeat-containing protein n=1 Tax=Sulfonitrofixus jiaomeiensis TaxID=3131938 RepID=UPI0031F9A46E
MITPETQTAIDANNKEALIDLLEEKDCPIEDVKAIYYANRDDKEIVGQTAMNLSLRTSVYDRDKEYSDTMVELLIDIAKNKVDMGARWAVAKNPHTPSEVLAFLANDEINLVRALVATNPSTPPKVLEKFFSDEKIVKDGLSGNPSTPIKLLKIFVNDVDKMVRMRLAENPSATKEILTDLLEDSDPNVSKAADIKLKEMKAEA